MNYVEAFDTAVQSETDEQLLAFGNDFSNYLLAQDPKSPSFAQIKDTIQELAEVLYDSSNRFTEENKETLVEITREKIESTLQSVANTAFE